MDESDETANVARAAWNTFAEGCAGGDWEGFIALLDPDLTFWLPSAPFKGENHGIERLRAFFHHVSVEAEGRLTFHEPFRTTRAGATTVFECTDEGTIRGKPIANRICLSFDVADGKVVAFREYIGLMP